MYKAITCLTCNVEMVLNRWAEQCDERFINTFLDEQGKICKLYELTTYKFVQAFAASDRCTVLIFTVHTKEAS